MLALRQPLVPRRGTPAASARRPAGRCGRLQCRATAAPLPPPRAAASSLPAPKRTPSSPLSSLSTNRLSGAMLASRAAKSAGGGAGAAKPLLQPPVPPRPTVTNINVIIAGSHQYLGRPELAQAAAGGADAAAAGGADAAAAGDADAAAAGSADDDDAPSAPAPVDTHKAFLDDPDAWASVMDPLEVPGGSRQLIYKFQDTPGLHSTVDYAHHLECLLTFLLCQQQKDKEMVQKSPGAGSLHHSATVLLYLLPPYGPLPKLDLVMMCALSEHAPLLPVILTPDAASAASEEAAAYQASAAAMLAKPSLAGLDLPPAKLFGFSDGRPLPLLLSPADGSSVTEELIRLLSDQELYGMLEHASSCFTSFVQRYAEAGDDLQQLVTSCIEGPRWSLGTGALKGELLVTREQLAKAEEKADQLTHVQEEVKQMFRDKDYDVRRALLEFPSIRAMLGI